MSDTGEELGASATDLGSVEDVSARVDLPAVDQEEDVDVTAYAYDDRPGEVVLEIGDGVTVTVTLDVLAAEQLAETLRSAAVEAEGPP